MTEQLLLAIGLFSLFLVYQIFSFRKKYLLNVKSFEDLKNEERDLNERHLKYAAEAEARIKNQEQQIQSLNEKVQELNLKIDHQNSEKLDLSKKISEFENTEEHRRQSFDERLTRLNVAIDKKEQEIELERQRKEEEEKQRLEELKKTWKYHEKNVEERLKVITQKYGLNYVSPDDFPHKGKPDNCVVVCDEYVIFDSKSPEGESLEHFPSYIRKQAEALKKYTKYDDVRKDVYLVVPFSTLKHVNEKYMEFGPYRVHVVSEESLETIIINLKKIEDYEFAEHLSPEDREKVVTLIGKMAHSMKRRIQVDYFFANHFITTLNEAENLPEEILKASQTVEASSKLNPPNEQRKKRIDKEKLLSDKAKLAGSAVSQNINIDEEESRVFNVPLHTSDKNESGNNQED